MKKNVASQVIGSQMTTAADGTSFTGTVSALVTVDGGTQGAGGGTVTHEGNGFHSYAPTQAETNGDHLAFTFTGTGAITATVQAYTSFPQTVDNATNIALILMDTGTTIPAAIAAIPTTAMRGTDSAATSAKQDTMETTLNAIPTTAMRGTDNAATATALATVDTNVDAILVDTSTTIPAQITALNNISAADVLAAGDIDGFSLEESQKLVLAAAAGIIAGAATNTMTIKAADGSKTRITATVDVDGNRSAVIKDVTG